MRIMVAISRIHRGEVGPSSMSDFVPVSAYCTVAEGKSTVDGFDEPTSESGEATGVEVDSLAPESAESSIESPRVSFMKYAAIHVSRAQAET